MEQPAGFAAQDSRTDMGIPIFWASANLDSPWQFKIWFQQFLMTGTVKENVMLEEPKHILDEPHPRPETPREGENEAAMTARNLRDKLARDRVMLENEERRTRGPRVCHNFFYNEVQKKLVSRFFSHSEHKERNNCYRRIHTSKSPNSCSGTLQSLPRPRFKG